MAADAFLKITDIKGETTDSKHKDEIEILSFSWGVTQPGSMGRGSGGGTGKAEFSDLSVTTMVDKATPVLMAKSATGEHLKEAKLTMRKAGKEQQEYLVVTMTDVLITSVQLSGGGGGGQEMANIALQFAKVDLEYKAQKPDGSLEGGVNFKYDLKENKVF